jgi:hypothetical protein
LISEASFVIVPALAFDLDAGIAQSVERRTENPCVGGSIPSPGISNYNLRLPQLKHFRLKEKMVKQIFNTLKLSKRDLSFKLI